MAGQSMRLLYCYLREKWTTLEISEGDISGGSGGLHREYKCLGVDETCRQRQCRLSNIPQDTNHNTRDPWFDE